MPHQGQTQAEVEARIAVAQALGLLVGGHGFGQPAQFGQDVAEVVESPGMVGLQGHGAAEMLLGRGKVLLARVEDAQSVMDSRLLRVQFEGTVKSGHGLADVVLGFAGRAENPPGVRIGRCGNQHLAANLLGRRVAAFLDKLFGFLHRSGHGRRDLAGSAIGGRLPGGRRRPGAFQRSLAALPPDLAKSRFEAAGHARRVAQLRPTQLLPQAGRNFASPAGLPVQRFTSPMYSAGVLAIHSLSPACVNTLATMRPRCDSPNRVMTGTPIQSDSQAVV